MKYIYPHYDECLTNLANSVLKYFDCDIKHNTLESVDKILDSSKPKNVIVILYDGMGANILDRVLDKDDFFIKNKHRSISSVFPPTTTAATTSVITGLNPCEHGWLGWNLYFKDIDKVVTMFLNTIKDTDIKVSDESISYKVYGYETIFDIINKNNKYKSFYISPFADIKYDDIDSMLDKIYKYSLEDGKKYIYAYYADPDTTMHLTGTDSIETLECIKMINDKTEKLCDKLEDSIVIVIADHGHINSNSIKISDYPEIMNMLSKDISVDARACSFFIKDEYKDKFKDCFNKYFGKDFILLAKKEVIDRNLFGAGICHEHFEESLGDYLAIAISDKYFKYDDKGEEYKSAHAGITEDEVYIPLIIIDKTKRKVLKR